MKIKKFVTSRPVRMLALALMLIVVFALSACGGAPGQAQVALNQVNDYYSTTVKMENAASAQFNLILTATNEQYQIIVTENPLIERCFKNSGSAIRDAVSGRYDKGVGQGSPTGVVNQALFGQALVVNEAYPDLSKCGDQVTKVANDVSAFRTTRLQNYTKLWDQKKDLDNQYFGDLGRSLAIPLLSKVGDEFMKTDLGRYFDPPKLWYPTFNLKTSIYDQEACTTFEQFYPGQAKWWPPTKECKLIGKAAYDQIFSPVLAPEVKNMVDTRTDTLNPNLGMPTAVPPSK